ncbi:hypothetical protein ACOSQ2_020351 [Xanthoceras sorbifolium]
MLLRILIMSNLFGTALGLLKQYPELARDDRNPYWSSNFDQLARRPLIFASGTRLGFWQSFIYHWIPLQEEKNPYPLPERVGGDIEKQTVRFESCSAESEPLGFLQYIRATFGELRHKLNTMFWSALMQLAPSIRRIHDRKQMHTQTLEIVRKMIGDYSNWNYVKAIKLLKKPAFMAATLGIYEVVNEILKAYNFSVSFVDHLGNTMLSTAVLNRQERVFNLVYQVCDLMVKDQRKMDKNKLGRTILHLAGVLAPSSEVPGAALQMQRELQWFKCVEDLFHPSFQGKHDAAGKTPREVFTDTHKVLVEKGEKWMKDTATSCSVVAALIITVVFTAAFTVPGGLDSQGRPNFIHELSFKIFAISIALALFSSTASVQMFLGILTSRYAEDDFLLSLPKKLITGLMLLFFSIASMMGCSFLSWLISSDLLMGLAFINQYKSRTYICSMHACMISLPLPKLVSQIEEEIDELSTPRTRSGPEEFPPVEGDLRSGSSGVDRVLADLRASEAKEAEKNSQPSINNGGFGEEHIVHESKLDFYHFEGFQDQIKILENKIRERNADVARYRSIYRSIREKNWKAVEDFVNNNPEALNDDITELGQNILLDQFDEAIGLVEKFVWKVPPESLERVNLNGNTALVIAAVSGNTKAAKVFVSKNKKLLSMREMGSELFPVHAAADCSRKETVEYLISVTAEVEDLTHESGAMLLKILIYCIGPIIFKSNIIQIFEQNTSPFTGTALGLLKQYPELARDDRNPYWSSNFDRLARKPLIFASGTRLGFWQSFVYHCWFFNYNPHFLKVTHYI